MRGLIFILRVVFLFSISHIFAQTSNINVDVNSTVNPLESSKAVDDRTRNNKSDNSQSRVIIGQGATIIISSSDDDQARILVKVVDVSSGGRLREVLKENDINVEYSDIIQKNDEILNSSSVPIEFTIEKAYPNPFNPVVNIRYGLPETSPVHIVIYNLAGHLVLDYNIGEKSAGWHDFQWNGTDVSGNHLGSGIYFVTVQANDIIKNQKVTFVK
ncbi:FlgD immunoglobulin-like domain containing protein [Candidatus Neomarinimicrobiota bacterium]